LFKTNDGLTQGLFLKLLECFSGNPAGPERLDRLNQLRRAGYASYLFGRDCHSRSLAT
jgi:hypothetical protein